MNATYSIYFVHIITSKDTSKILEMTALDEEAIIADINEAFVGVSKIEISKLRSA